VGAQNQVLNDQLTRAISAGVCGRAAQLAQLQAETSKAGLGLQAAGQTAQERISRAGLGLQADALQASEDRAQAGLGLQASQAADAQRNQRISQGLQASGMQDVNRRFNQQTALQQQRVQLDRSMAEAGLDRQDVGMASDLVQQRFDQDMATGQFDLSRSRFNLERDLTEAGLEREDIDRVSRIAQQQWQSQMGGAQFAAQEQQRILDSQLQALVTDENIFGQRASQAQQPLSMLLSALSGTNVAPGVLGPMQMPTQRPPAPSGGEVIASLAGQMIPGLPFMRG